MHIRFVKSMYFSLQLMIDMQKYILGRKKVAAAGEQGCGYSSGKEAKDVGE